MTTRPLPQTTSIFSRTTLVMIVTRLIAGTGTQIFFPFLPIIAAGLGVTEVELGRMLGLRSLSALTAPIFGTTADKRGYRRVIQLALFIAASGNFIIYFSRSLPIFVVGLFFLGIGTVGINPTMSAYLSHILPFEQRSRGLGLLEYSWALVSLVMLPLVGWLIDASSWRLPFLVMGGLELIAIFWFIGLPRVVREADQRTTRPSLKAVVQDFLDFGDNWRSAMAVLIGDNLTRFSGLMLALNFGTWLSRDYGLAASDLGQVAFVLGFADICGSSLVVFVGDRLGKRRSVLVATALGVILYSILPIWNIAFIPAVIGIFIARWSFEFAIVSHIILVSEQSPAHRGKMMTMRMGLGVLAVALASTFGPALFDAFGIWGISLPGALGLATAFAIAWGLVVERG